jgi:hypothetical protein
MEINKTVTINGAQFDMYAEVYHTPNFGGAGQLEKGFLYNVGDDEPLIELTATTTEQRGTVTIEEFLEEVSQQCGWELV